MPSNFTFDLSIFYLELKYLSDETQSSPTFAHDRTPGLDPNLVSGFVQNKPHTFATLSYTPSNCFIVFVSNQEKV